ncbi:tRNA (adenosine(37)-N6)-dimethylallyltransferase MiaA [Candidatus Berkelbacteria bacterium]|nr:tRNA (adenosine(37)-N6)-dimethylallyltransferase MiaA [Candidatus Berkelbacteria bacterium]
MVKLVVVTGPTMAGKTELGIQLAKEFNGAIISADSRAIYKGLDIGTNKPTFNQQAEQRFDYYVIKEVRHYGLDIVEPIQDFTVKDFKDLADQKINEISDLGQVPMLVGGSGLYVEAVIDRFDFAGQVIVDNVIKNLPIAQLIKRIEAIDPQLIQGIDLKNRRRLEPILARAQAGSMPKSGQALRPNTLLLVVDRPRQELYERSDRQVDNWLKWGLLDEVARIAPRISDSDFKQLGLVYYLSWQYLEGKFSKNDFITKLKFGLHGLIRRQLTWWRRRPDARWVSGYTDSKDIIDKFLGVSC